MVITDTIKPREEHDSREFYPDLHYTESLPVFVTRDQIHHHHHHHRVYKPQDLNKPNFKQIPKEILPTDNVKIGARVMKLGYKSSSLSENNAHDQHSTYIRELDYLQQRDINILTDISQNQIMFKSLYDMDEQDSYLLAYLKDQKFHNITPEIFECCLTILENEWFQLELKIPPKLRQSSKSSNMEDLKNFINMYSSDDGIGLNESIDDQNCAVCNESDCDNSNAIIFCDGCDIAVHQDCYGVLFIPEGQWLCRKCMITKNKKVKCQFCPSLTGAFKQTANGLWAHVLCGLWIPELYFASVNHMEPIEGIELVPKGRWKLHCNICKLKQGACIQCANKNCFSAFHVTCAKRSGLYMEFGKGVQGAVLDQSSLSCFCEKHGPPELIPTIKQGIMKTRLYFDYLNNITKNKSSIFKSGETSSGNTSKKWKTSRGTPIAPNYFIKIVQSFLLKFKIEKAEELAQLLTRYWSMKREMKKGAPLIRRVSSTITGGDPNEIPSKLDFSKILLDDLAKLDEINKMVIQRETLKLESVKTLKEQIDVAYFSHNIVIENLLAKILKVDASRFLLKIPFEKNLDYILAKTKENKYTIVNDFMDELSDFFQEVEKRNDSLEIKSKNRILREIAKDLEVFVNWDETVNPEIDLDFVIDGINIERGKYRGLIAMEEEELSELEDDDEENNNYN